MNNAQKTIKSIAIVFAVFIVVNIISGIVSGLSFIYGFDPHDASRTDYFNSFEKVDDIDIDLKAASLTIKTGTSFEIKAYNVDSDFEVTYENNNLNISEKSRWFVTTIKVPKITIYVPKDYVLGELKINGGVNKIVIDNIQATYLELKQGVGDLNINNSTFEQTNIKGGVGNTDINVSTLNNLDLETGVGDIDVEAHIAGDNRIKCGIGRINLLILGNKEDYQIHVNKGLGKVTINRENQSDDSIYGQGQNKINLNGGIGDVKVSFNN